MVGWAELPSGNYHAFVYDGLEMIDLGTLGGFYSSAYGISDNGTIVGWAHDSLGRTQAVRWVPVPEPSTLVSLAGLLSLGAAVLYRKRQISVIRST